jgi:hypothetical protein
LSAGGDLKAERLNTWGAARATCGLPAGSNRPRAGLAAPQKRMPGGDSTADGKAGGLGCSARGLSCGRRSSSVLACAPLSPACEGRCKDIAPPIPEDVPPHLGVYSPGEARAFYSVVKITGMPGRWCGSVLPKKKRGSGGSSLRHSRRSGRREAPRGDTFRYGFFFLP